MNHYELTIINLKKLIAQELWDEAWEIVQKEQRQPYIPNTFAKNLQKYEAVIKQHLLPKKEIKYFFKQDFYEIMQQIKDGLPLTEGLFLMQSLARFNLRNYLKPIADLLMTVTVAKPIKTNLFMLLIQQEINTPIKYFRQDGGYDLLVPVNFNVFAQEPLVRNILAILEEWVASDNVALYELCLELLRMIFDQVFPDYSYLEPARVAAGAILVNAERMQGLNGNLQQIATTYQLELKSLIKISEIFKEIINDYDQDCSRINK